MTIPTKVYHTSSIQNLKSFVPRKLSSYHSEEISGKRVIYLTDNLMYASAFSFPWSEDQGVTLDSYDGNKTFRLRLPRKLTHMLYAKSKVSLYEFKFDPRTMMRISGNDTPEFITELSITPVLETKFETPRSLMEYSGLEVNIY